MRGEGADKDIEVLIEMRRQVGKLRAPSPPTAPR